MKPLIASATRRSLLMALILMIAAWCGSVGAIQAQTPCDVAGNLVPNPSFECRPPASCPTTESMIHYAMGWLSAHQDPNYGTPDYFNSCDISFCNFGVPVNRYGIQDAHNPGGQGYVGIAQSELRDGHMWREYIRTTLTSPLVAGTRYRVRYYVNLAESSNRMQGRIGVLVGTDVPFVTGWVHPVRPADKYRQAPAMITDTDNWVEVTDTITADGGENTIVIGFFDGFFVDRQSRTASGCNVVGFAPRAYYFIDDVYLGVDALGNDNSCTYYQNNISYRIEPIEGDEDSCCYRLYASNNGYYNYTFPFNGFFLTSNNYLSFTNGEWSGNYTTGGSEPPIKWTNTPLGNTLPARAIDVPVGSFCAEKGGGPNLFEILEGMGELFCDARHTYAFGCETPCCDGLSISAASVANTDEYCEWNIIASQPAFAGCAYAVEIRDLDWFDPNKAQVVYQWPRGTSPIYFGGGTVIGRIRIPKVGTATPSRTIMIRLLGSNDQELVCLYSIGISCLGWGPPLN